MGLIRRLGLGVLALLVLVGSCQVRATNVARYLKIRQM